MATATAQFEDVTLEELSARYLRILACERKKGYGADTPEGHFQLALLYLGTGRFEAIGGDNGMRYRIPDWSDFAAKAINEKEAQ